MIWDLMLLGAATGISGFLIAILGSIIVSIVQWIRGK